MSEGGEVRWAASCGYKDTWISERISLRRRLLGGEIQQKDVSAEHSYVKIKSVNEKKEEGDRASCGQGSLIPVKFFKCLIKI